jgi:hypothetical protein
VALRGPGFSLSQPVEISPPPPSRRMAARLAWIAALPETVRPGQPLPFAIQVENTGDGAWRETADGPSGGAAPARLGQIGRLGLWWAAADLAPQAAWALWERGDRALWAAAAHSDLGQYVVRIRWRQGERALFTRLAPLGQDLFPGQRLRLQGLVPAPTVPGGYRLELALLSPAGLPLSPESGSLLQAEVRVASPVPAP